MLIVYGIYGTTVNSKWFESSLLLSPFLTSGVCVCYPPNTLGCIHTTWPSFNIAAVLLCGFTASTRKHWIQKRKRKKKTTLRGKKGPTSNAHLTNIGTIAGYVSIPVRKGAFLLPSSTVVSSVSSTLTLGSTCGLQQEHWYGSKEKQRGFHCIWWWNDTCASDMKLATFYIYAIMA